MENNITSGTVGIHLNKLNGASVVDVRGKKCVVIPVEENGIYISDKGTIVLSYFMSKLQEEKWGKTHSLKRKLTKEEYKTWTKEQKDNNPIAGYFEPYVARANGYNNGGYNPQPNAPQTPQPTYNSANSMGGDVADLPF